MLVAVAAGLAHSLVPPAPVPPSTADPCEEVLERGDPGGRFTAQRLARLADVGQSFPTGATRAFEVSPDAKSVALVVTRANPNLNAYCQKLLLVPTDGSDAPVEIDRGGEFNHFDYMLRDFSSIRVGWQRPNAPHFSPDGTQLAFMKRIDSSTQAWLAPVRGDGPATQVTHSRNDVEDVAWAENGAGLVIATRPDLREQSEAIAREAAEGFLFDDRFSPQIGDRPLPTGMVPTAYHLADLAEHSMREATAGEIGRFVPLRPAELPAAARQWARSRKGALAWIAPVDSDLLIGPTRLVREGKDGVRRVCGLPECEDLREVWWSRDGATLFALGGSGWAHAGTVIVVWRAFADMPSILVNTEDAIFGCASLVREQLCAREGSTRPRRLVAFDNRTGRERVVFDPNPDLEDAVFGSVRRLRLRNAFDSESFADLVLPPDHRPGERHPLVIVQYNSQGFLRGGTGDEVPIHPLANRGFAVLSFNRPAFAPQALAATSPRDLLRTNRHDWLDRRNVQSSLERAIAAALASGAVDPDRIGISGFSDGASTVQWALTHQTIFKAASLGSCCEDLYSYPVSAGPAFTRFVRDLGYRYFEKGAENFWKPMSLILNVDTITLPILIQNADSEYEGGLDVFETYSHRGRPIELFVFDDETHIKWQPAHRLAVYRRNLDWFGYWLSHLVDCDPGKARQYERWGHMAGAPDRSLTRCLAGTLPRP